MNAFARDINRLSSLERENIFSFVVNVFSNLNYTNYAFGFHSACHINGISPHIIKELIFSYYASKSNCQNLFVMGYLNGFCCKDINL
ncbi:hypothetical protein MCEZLEM10_01326 [Methylophilaceae bacterium]